ncbi:MAG: hypothetical protein EBX41_00540 [Chitinophagia bacterium]|nr:hypothetical protein [Chitinophagia bacterium]
MAVVVHGRRKEVPHLAHQKHNYHSILVKTASFCDDMPAIEPAILLTDTNNIDTALYVFTIYAHEPNFNHFYHMLHRALQKTLL